ncbi:Asp23/Gls24 family envelope stress response protein [Peptostreptococcus faecalis]|uniref:hypothetical protein n=1 Tax=Peptostreptococcus faecalis TaxID=2045015 RepID=UPI000C7AA15A|nr:hypothetical protein [Peptostreptococcus faecalis]
MSKFRKIINSIYYLLILMLLSAIYIFVFKYVLADERIIFIDTYKLLQTIPLLLGILSFIVFMATVVKLILILFKKSDERELVLFEDNGTISVSDMSIEKNVINTLEKFDEIAENTVRASIKKKGDKTIVKVDVKCGINEELCIEKGYFDIEKIESIENANSTENIDKTESVEVIENVDIVENADNTENVDNIKKIESNESEENKSEENKLDDKEEFSKEIAEARSVLVDDESEDNENIDAELHKYADINDFYKNVQKDIRDSLENFFEGRINEINVKFYNAKINEKVESGIRSEKEKSVKKSRKRKKKRVN